jgi:parvulin-like peptidyl-prolyl isomerase
MSSLAVPTPVTIEFSLWERLVGYQMAPQLIKEIILDTAIAEIEASPVENQSWIEAFYLRHRITSTEIKQNWLRYHRMSQSQLEHQAIRYGKIEQYKQQRWASQIESLFLSQKGQFDQVIYSLLRTKDRGVSQELFFRLQEGEQTFAALATQYSQGPEAQTGGLVGPIELGRLQVPMLQLLQQRQPGKLYPPMQMDQWVVILRLEHYIPATLNDALRQRLIDQKFQEWLQHECTHFDLSTLTPEPR